MTHQEQAIRHIDTTITWPAALSIWFISGGVLMVTVMLSFVGLLLNAFSAGHEERQGLSWSQFHSPAPSSVLIFIVLGVALLAFTQGWCLMAGAAFKKTYKEAYVWNAYVGMLVFVAALILVGIGSH